MSSFVFTPGPAKGIVVWGGVLSSERGIVESKALKVGMTSIYLQQQVMRK